MTVHKAVIALGSNLGDRVGNLREAVERLRRGSVSGIEESSIWMSAPVGFAEEVPDFANAVIRCETELDAHSLLATMQKIEQEMGRLTRRGSAYESRTIDLDLIDHDGQMIRTQDLVLPHPSATQRLFVLLPLQEIDPAFRIQGQEKSIAALIDAAPVIQLESVTPLNPSA